VFYPTISQRSCHVKNCTCTQNVATYSLFNIQEFYSACAMRFCSVSRCFLQLEAVYSVRLLCTEYSLKHKCFIRRYRSDPPMYSIVHAPKMSAYPDVQYTRVSSCFFNITFFYTQLYFRWGDYLDCALTLNRTRVETKVFYLTISQRSCHALYCT